MIIAVDEGRTALTIPSGIKIKAAAKTFRKDLIAFFMIIVSTLSGRKSSTKEP
jgi:hypothetical protein